MEQLARKVYANEKGERLVNARDLHEALCVETPYRLWMPRMLEYGFVENVDYTPYIFVHPSNQQETSDYALTLDCAKEIAMLQRTEKGKEVRQYFIAIEKKMIEEVRNPAANITKIDLAKMLIESEEQRIATETKLFEANSTIEANAPKVLFAEAVSASSTSVLIKELAAYLTQNGFTVGQNRLYQLLRFNGFLGIKGDYYNLPSQRALEMKLFEVRKTAIHKPDGTVLTNSTTLVTGKGLGYFLSFFLNQQKRA